MAYYLCTPIPAGESVDFENHCLWTIVACSAQHKYISADAYHCG